MSLLCLSSCLPLSNRAITKPIAVPRMEGNNNLSVSAADSNQSEDTSEAIAKREPPTNMETTPLSSFGIEPGVCLKNVAAIITQQQQQQQQQAITSAQPNGTPKELPPDVIAGTKEEKPDFHFDRHSPFTGTQSL